MRILKVLFPILITILLNLPAASADSKPDLLKLDFSFPIVSLAADTIYQIDTVYQYEIIYDTLYYFDTIPQTDTLMLYDTQILDTDSSVVVTQFVEFRILENKRVFTSKSPPVEDNSLRDFGGLDASDETSYPTGVDNSIDFENEG